VLSPRPFKWQRFEPASLVTGGEVSRGSAQARRAGRAGCARVSRRPRSRNGDVRLGVRGGRFSRHSGTASKGKAVSRWRGRIAGTRSTDQVVDPPGRSLGTLLSGAEKFEQHRLSASAQYPPLPRVESSLAMETRFVAADLAMAAELFERGSRLSDTGSRTGTGTSNRLFDREFPAGPLPSAGSYRSAGGRGGSITAGGSARAGGRLVASSTKARPSTTDSDAPGAPGVRPRKYQC